MSYLKGVSMSRKITIIGAGSVGSTIAYSLSQEELASQIVMIDINKDKAEGEVMDIEQGTCFREPISIIAGDYPDAKDSDIVIITSGIARKPGQTYGIYALGKTGTDEEIHVEQPETSDSGSAPSQSTVCVPRFLWMQAFQ